MQWRRCCSCLLSAKVELFEDITKKGTRITLHNALFLTKARNVPRLIFFPQFSNQGTDFLANPTEL